PRWPLDNLRLAEFTRPGPVGDRAVRRGTGRDRPRCNTTVPSRAQAGNPHHPLLRHRPSALAPAGDDGEAEMTDQANRVTALSWQVEQWLRRRTSRAADWALDDLLAWKGATTISVVIPARNESSTVGEIVRTIRRELVDGAGLVDELLVVDSRSTDATARVAAEAGATVVAEQDVLAQLPPMYGKGEALWKGVAASSGDLVVFVDGDLREFSASYVTGL